MDMETLGYYIYMDEAEKRDKAAQIDEEHEDDKQV